MIRGIHWLSDALIHKKQHAFAFEVTVVMKGVIYAGGDSVMVAFPHVLSACFFFYHILCMCKKATSEGERGLHVLNWEQPGWELSGVGIVWVGVTLGGKFPGRKCPAGSFLVGAVRLWVVRWICPITVENTELNIFLYKNILV